MALPTDDLFEFQWHLKNTGQFGATPGMDINVEGAWDVATGAGVSVGVYDSGIQYTHQDLNDNYDASLSVIIDGVAHDPYPVTTDSGNNHGTSVAGLIAAERNGEGVVGGAYDAKLTGVDIFAMNDSQFLQSLQQMTNFDVTNHSYGYSSPYYINRLNAGFTQNFVATFKNAADTGREGLGSITVHSGGNDRTNQFNSGFARDANDDNFTNSRYVVSVAALGIDGFVTHYSTPGAPILVSAPAAGVDGQTGVWTTDFLGEEGYNSGSDTDTDDNPYPDYNSTMSGTSAASPIVASVVALMLEANPELGWRDVKEILAYTARHVGSEVGAGHTGNGTTTWELNDWTFNAATNWNGGGLHFNNDYGFGLVDAAAAVRLAKSWTAQSTSANEQAITHQAAVSLAVPDNNATGVSHVFNVSGYGNFSIEHVTLQIDWSTRVNVNQLVITLTSPDGLTSYIINRQGTAFGGSGAGVGTLPSFEFASNAFRGMNDVNGDWTIKVSDNLTGGAGTISGIKLVFYGVSDSADDSYIYTNEYGVYAGTFNHSQLLADSDGGVDTINAAAVSTDLSINLTNGDSGTIAGQAFATDGSVENVIGGAGNDFLYGNTSDNRLDGGDGNDTLVAYTGTDHLIGGRGNDTLTAGFAGDSLLDGGAGVDTAGFTTSSSGVTVTLATQGVAQDIGGGQMITLIGIESILGSFNGDTLTGDGGANRIHGLNGADTIIGGDGDDELLGGEGTDTVSYATAAAGVTVSLAIVGVAQATGGAGTDMLSEFENVTGSTFDDVLAGAAGANILTGLAGNDIYFIDDASDNVVEGNAVGYDLINSSVTYSLAGRYVEELVLTGSANIDGTGNGFANKLIGNSGTNALRGLGGDDVLEGGAGDDLIDGGAGTGDIASYAGSANGVTVSLLTQGVAQNTVGAGMDTLSGIEGLTGSTKADTLTGDGNANRIDGGLGADTMTGGGGNDVYFVNVAGDVVVELDGGGNDTVNSSTSYSLVGRFIEDLTLTGASNINATGNDGVNRMTGNIANNILDGGLGADILIGGRGNDIYVVDNAGDVVDEKNGEGIDEVRTTLASYTLTKDADLLTGLLNTGQILTGNARVNTIVGGDGADRINAGGNADVMRGGKGDDIYFVDNVGDVVTEVQNEGTDTVNSSVGFTLVGSYVEKLILTGTGAINGTGNALANEITGNSGANVIDGGGGLDSLFGGAGADTFKFSTAPSASNRDTILDFSVVDDIIALASNIFGAAGPAGVLAAAAFQTGAVALEADDRIVYDAGTGNIFYDADGSGVGAAVRFASVTAGLALTNADFVIL